MPISTKWYDEKKQVIFQKYEGAWTWEELDRESVLKFTIAQSVLSNVVLFSDMSQANLLPRGNLLSNGLSIFTHLPNNITEIIVVVQSPTIKRLTKITIEMVPYWRKRVHFADTFAEGQLLVAKAVQTNIETTNRQKMHIS